VKEFAKESAKSIAAGAAAAGSGIGAIAAFGVPGLSAAGISSGLAVLGFGSMLVGVGTVGVIGYSSYRLTQAIIEKVAIGNIASTELED
jgi:hypothetical protein